MSPLLRALLPLLCLMAPAGYAQEDTLTRRLPEVQVEAPAPAVPPLGLPLHRWSKAELERLRTWQLSELLSLLPGVFVRDYGGASGLKTLSLRGLGAVHTLVLWDGVRLNTPAQGLYDLGNVPSSVVEEVVLLRGGSSALFGANAGAGVLLLRSLQMPAEGFALGLGGGSFGEWRASARLADRFQAHAVQLAGELLRSRGDYPFPSNQFGQLTWERRQNADRTAAALMGAWQYWDGHTRLWLRSSAQWSVRGVPGPVVQGRVEFARARLWEREWHTAATLLYQLPTDELHVLSWMRWSELRYRDPDALVWGPNGADESGLSTEYAAQLRWNARRGQLSSTLSAEVLHEALSGSMLKPHDRSSAARQRAALAALGWWSPLPSLTVIAGLRWELYSSHGAYLSPTLGAEWGSARTHLRASWSYNIRPPSFVELYYFNFGNAALRPERVHSWNLGIELGSRTLAAALELFTLLVTDQIVALPRSPVFWSTFNVGRVWSRGVEAMLEFAPIEYLRLSATATWQRTTDQGTNPYTRGRQLPYTPQLLGSAALTVRRAAVELGLHLHAVGQRWSQPDNSPQSRLAPYATLDATAGTELRLFGGMLQLRARVHNVLGASYEVIRNYPMPGRSVRLEVRWDNVRAPATSAS